MNSWLEYMGRDSAWRRLARSRYGFTLFCLLNLLVAWTLLRVVLMAAFFSAGVPAREAVLTVLAGFYRDLFCLVLYSLPLLGWLMTVPGRVWAWRVHRFVFWSAAFVCASVQIFLVFVEYFFFDEFKSRFNTVAVDYLIYPQEVFVNIWQSYHAGWIIFGCVAAGAGWVLVARKWFRPMWETPCRARTRVAWFAGALVLLLAMTPGLQFQAPRVSADRAVNEIANSGPLSFIAAAWTRHLEYSAFYLTLPREAAWQRARRRLSQPGAEFVAPDESIRRHVAGDATRPKLNVVIMLEESLGSEFWGSLGARFSFTPEMDRLAAAEGLLFTNIFASGNRTVRGMEGVLSSFPPLPGDSIVKRNLSDNVETIARLLKRDGYSTLFVYGGRGLFDGMRSFALRNGYDRFIEQHDFPNPTFTTAWGVCDEDIFNRAIEEFRALDAAGKPFFATTLSVSNHKPYTFPKGRIAENPDDKVREWAVKYSDYALGRFFDAARREAFWTNTVFVVVADHGARVYGSQTIPIHSYEIPLLIVGPAAVKAPARLGQLGCSLDVAPTVLGLIGRPYDTLFFGRDLLNDTPAEGRALLNHNRDIGMLAGDRLAVLGLMKQSEMYAGDPQTTTMQLAHESSPGGDELLKDTIALFQVADELYMSRTYALDPGGRPDAPAALAAARVSRTGRKRRTACR